jgi:hypothetical protein
LTDSMVVLVPGAVAVQGLGSKGEPGVAGDPGPTGDVGPVGPGYLASSISSRTIAAPASVTFITQTGLAYTPGMRARASATVSPTNWMEGQVTGYSGASLTIAMDLVNGTGTFAAWNLNLSGERGGIGLQGLRGLQGDQGIQGIPGVDGVDGTDGAGYGGTSSTLMMIEEASKTFDTQAGMAYVVGSRIRLASASNPGNFMEGTVTAYAGISMTASITNTGGSGTLADWNLSLAGIQGAPGSVGPAGGTAIRGHIAGLILSNASGVSSGSMSISIGEASADVAPYTIIPSTTVMTKTAAAWAAGTGNGGLDTGAIAANTWYYWYLIQRPDTGDVDFIFSLSSTAPNLPTNYSLKRRIGAMRTNSASQWPLFKQYGYRFILNAPFLDLSTTAGNTIPANVALTVPRIAGVRALFRAIVAHGTGSNVAFYALDEADTAINANFFISLSAALQGAGHFEVTVNASAQIRYNCSVASTAVRISTYGWIDERGRLD